METPGQAMDTELGWPGPLHLVTVGFGVGPARSPQPQPGPKGARGVPMPWGAAPQGGHGVVRAVVARVELAPGNGAGEHPALLILVSSSSFFPAYFPHLDLLLFLSSPPLLAILVSLLLSSSQISLSSSFELPPASLLSAFMSFSSSSLLDLPLFSSCPLVITSLTTFSSPLQSLLSSPEMTWGHAVCHHHPHFRAGGGSLFPPAPSRPQHCPQLVLMSPGWDRAVPPAQATVAPTPAALHVLPSQ